MKEDMTEKGLMTAAGPTLNGPDTYKMKPKKSLKELREDLTLNLLLKEFDTDELTNYPVLDDFIFDNNVRSYAEIKSIQGFKKWEEENIDFIRSCVEKSKLIISDFYDFIHDDSASIHSNQNQFIGKLS
jgi:hypothetical protein